jgi:hypothetical protein
MTYALLNKGMKQLILLCFIVLGIVCNPVLSFAEESSKTKDPSASTSDTEVKYWITSTGKRHNPSCRYYGTTKSGRYTTNKDEGAACGKCGG